MNNLVRFDILSSKEYLTNLLESSLDNAVSSEPMEVNSIIVKLDRVGAADIQPKDDVIDVFLPLKINLTRSAGLFTVEGNGAMKLHLSTKIDITKDLRLRTETQLVNHEWIEKPKLEIGALNIPVETLINMVLKHQESILTAKIDQTLKKFSNLNVLINEGLAKAKEKIAELDLKNNKVHLCVEEIGLARPQIVDGIVGIRGYIKPDISVNEPIDIHYKNTNFRWLRDGEVVASELHIPFQLNYDLLEEQIKEKLQGMNVAGQQFDIRSINVNGGEQLEIQMVIDEPIKAQVFIHGIPTYNEIDGMLNMDQINVKVNPGNFIYKLTAPLVNKFVEKKMEEFFPVKINELLGNAVKEHIPQRLELEKGNVEIKQSEVSIGKLDFEREFLKGICDISGLHVTLDVDPSSRV